MKRISSFFFLFVAFVWVACSPKERYLDLNTGERIELEKDPVTGVMVNAETKQPVYIYVDTETNDTIYGSNGEVINGQVVKTEDSSYKYKGDYKYKSPDEDLKVKVDDDGDIKIKDDEGKEDSKMKIEGETGGKKVKNGDRKEKSES